MSVRIRLFVLCCGLQFGCSSSAPEPEQVPPPTNFASQQSALTSSVDYATMVTGDGAVGYWRLGERTGPTAIDSTTAQNSGTYQGAPLATLDKPGALVADRDGATSFYPRSNQFVVVPHNANQAPTDAITVEAWVTIPSLTSSYPATDSAIVLKTTPNSPLMQDGYGIYYYLGKLYFYINNLNIRAGVAVPATANGGTAAATETAGGRFHHVVGTYDRVRGTIEIWYDGVRAETYGYTAAINAGTYSMFIGRGPGTTMGWYGKIDEVALYNKSLTQKQIEDHYRAGIGATPIDPVTPNTGLTTYYGGNILVPTYTYPPSAGILERQTV